MVKICGYSYDASASALILADIIRSTKINERGERSNDNIITIENIILPEPNNFPNIVSELEVLRDTHQLHLAQYEPLRMRLGLAREYLHFIMNIKMWQMAEELYNFLISQNRLMFECEIDLSKDFIKKSFHTLILGSLYHVCPKAEYRSQEIQYKNYPLLLEYIRDPLPHPLEPERHWNGDLVTSFKY